MTKPKPAAKPTRWWANVDTDGVFPPTLCRLRREAMDDRDSDNGWAESDRRFVVRRVEIKEV